MFEWVRVRGATHLLGGLLLFVAAAASKQDRSSSSCASVAAGDSVAREWSVLSAAPSANGLVATIVVSATADAPGLQAGLAV